LPKRSQRPQPCLLLNRYQIPGGRHLPEKSSLRCLPRGRAYESIAFLTALYVAYNLTDTHKSP
jgi:hypothetical protein